MDSASPDASCIAGEQSTNPGTHNTFAFTFWKLAEKPALADPNMRGSRQSHRSPAGHGTPQ